MAKRTSSSRSRKTPRRSTGRRRRAKKQAKRPQRRPTKRAVRRAPAKARRASRATKARRRTARPRRRESVRPVDHDLRPPTLARERRQLPDDERIGGPNGDPGTDARLLSEAKAGHDAVAKSMRRHTESSPVLTAGDVDARWDEAYSVGDESPGGDNPTPDQNEVEAIGRALGTEYDDDEELMGGDEIGARDTHRWELDPQSRDDDDT